MPTKIPGLPDSVGLLTELPKGNMPNVVNEGDGFSLIWSDMNEPSLCAGFTLQFAIGVITVLEGIVYPEKGAVVPVGQKLTLRDSTVVHFAPSLDHLVRVHLWVI